MEEDDLPSSYQFEEESDDDIEWENANDVTSSELESIDWKAISNTLNEQAQGDALPKKKRRMHRLSIREKTAILVQHKAHLLSLYARERLVHQYACCSTSSRILQAKLLSILPIDLHVVKVTQESITKVIRWFYKTFSVLDNEVDDNTFSEFEAHSHLDNVLTSRKGYSYQLVLLFVNLCRSIGLDTRYTVALDARRLKFKTGRQYEVVSFFSQQRRNKNRNTMPTPSTRTWTEIFVNNSWIHVDPIGCIVNSPAAPEETRRAVLPYVVSFSRSATDVSKRYALRWSKTRQFRLASPHDTWWKSILFEKNILSSSPSSSASVKRNNTTTCESKQLDDAISCEEIPTSVEAFRSHHLYCLEKFCTKNECIYPRSPVLGIIKGYCIFPRENLKSLFTKYQWKRTGREVKDETPAKVYSFTKEDSEVKVELFGEWQTTELKPTSIVDGKLPINEHGNVEIYAPSYVPKGAVHVIEPNHHHGRRSQTALVKLASSLDIQFVPALVDWETKAGKNYPIFDGVVILQEDAGVLNAAMEEQEHQRLIKKKAAKQRLISLRWEKLVKRFVLRTRLQSDYGPY